MADKIVFRYESMSNAAGKIEDIAARFSTAATTFQSDFQSSTNGWEGETKEKMQAFIDGAVMEYLGKSLPDVLNALSQLLKVNIDTMQKTDQEIGASIPQSLSES